MPKRGGLGQRGLDLLISASSGIPEQSEQEAASGIVKDDKKTKSRGKKNPAGSGKTGNAAGTTGTKSASKRAGTKTAGTKASAKAPTGKQTSGRQKRHSAGAGAGSDNATINNAKANTETAKVASIGAKSASQEAVALTSEPLEILIDKIEPNRSQPRKNFEEDALQELAESIRQYGVIQPLIVQKKDDYYEIVAGERRWRAARIAGLKKLPVIVKDYTPREIMEISLIENIQREDLNPIEEAAAYQRLMEEYSLRQDEVAQRVSRSRAAIANSVRLLKLDQRVQDMVVGEMLTTGHARALLAIADPDLQYTTAQRVFDEKMSVRETEREVRKLLESPRPARKPAVSDTLRTIYAGMEEDMKTSLGTKVTISPKSPQKGKIEIEYYSSDDLDRLCAILKMPYAETRG